MITGGSVPLYVNDMQRAVRFYVEKLAFKVTARHEDGTTDIDAGGGFILSLQKGDEDPSGSHGELKLFGCVRLEVNIPIDDAIAVLENRGIVFAKGVVDMGGLRRADFTDIDGNAFYLFERARDASVGTSR
jgi:catechol 2,3-dioxygenase-like lactoylglutathione lyase family enzyme